MVFSLKVYSTMNTGILLNCHIHNCHILLHLQKFRNLEMSLVTLKFLLVLSTKVIKNMISNTIKL